MLILIFRAGQRGRPRRPGKRRPHDDYDDR